MQKISSALVRNGIRDVYGFGNSWSLVQHPELTTVLDAWVAAGHHVGNHTHSHLVLTEIGWERYRGEIDLADRQLAPWLSKAPNHFFRYPLCHWGDTEEKCAKVLAHLAAKNYHQPMFQAGGTNGTGIELGATPEIALIPKP
jgi:peptidoglycan-N-acetylglucosamine deacetylase